MKLSLFIFFLHGFALFGATATWNGTSLDWNTASGWTPATVPNGVGDEADFNLASIPPPANPTISISAPTIVGTIVFDSSTDYTLDLMGGTLTLQAPSTSSSAITVNSANGTGSHTIAAGFGLSSPLTVSQNSSATFTISGAITGAQSLTKQGTGVLSLSGLNLYSGGTVISQGTITITADTNLGNPLTTSVSIGNGTLQFDGNIGTARPFSLTGGATIDVTPGNSSSISGIVSGAGSLTKTNSGSLFLQAANTYQGGTVIGAGALFISTDANLGDPAGPLIIGTGTLATSAGILSNRSGAFTGAAVIDTGGNNSTFSGSFSGTGSLTVTGAGTLNLIGPNSYSGGTTIATGTELAGNTQGIQGNITLNTASSLLTFDQDFDGAYSGVLTSGVASAGVLTKLGPGAITLTSANPSFSGSTAITQGVLIVDGSIANSSVTIGIGGVLGGTGTVGPTTSDGLIDPATRSTVGTLSINGALTLNGSSHVNINLAPLSADKIAVNNMATLNGGLSIDPTPGFYGFSADYTILTSTNRAGTFGSPTSTNPAFVPSLTYTATDVLLHVAISQPFAVFPFSNFNTAAVGHNIDALAAAGELSSDLLSVFNTFIGQSVDTINDALDQMHPAPYSAFTEMQAELSGQLISLFHRLPYLTCCCPRANRLWIEPFGNSLTMKHHGMEIGFQANSGGLAFGYDRQVSEHLFLGAGGAWSNSHLRWHDHQGHGTVNGLYGGIYFDSQFDQFYLGGSFLAGVDFYDTSRHLEFVTTNRHATASFNALDVMAQIATAYLFGSPQAFFYPYANLDYLYLSTASFNESGANGLDLSVQHRSDGTLRTEMGLGLQVQDTNREETMCISPLVSLGWVNIAPLSRPLLKSTFAGADIPFAVKGWDETWNLLTANFGLTITYRCFRFFLQYDVEISPNSDTTLFNQHGNFRFDWKW